MYLFGLKFAYDPFVNHPHKLNSNFRQSASRHTLYEPWLKRANNIQQRSI